MAQNLRLKILYVAKIILLFSVANICYCENSEFVYDEIYSDQEEGISDPFESINRKTYVLNAYVDNIVIRPAAEWYTKYTPNALQIALKNFFTNLATPLVIVNDILQFKPKNAVYNMWSFITNSTVGILGITDISKVMGLERENNNFSNTLAFYNVKPGPYIVLPIVGPTTLRGVPDKLIDTILFFPSTSQAALIPSKILSERAKILPSTTEITNISIDEYITVRSIIYQIDNK